jgi:hypothetical protein
MDGSFMFAGAKSLRVLEWLIFTRMEIFIHRKEAGMKRILMIATLVLALMALLATVVQAAGPFKASLNGAQEVPVRMTKASGTASFRWNADASSANFVLTVKSIRNVFAAHIHCGAPGVNGPVGVTLFMGTPGSGLFNGTLAQGTITAPDPGNGCGWLTMQDVHNAMNSGNTYVNVHTNDGVAPPNTGPGDFPGGEIRGHNH